MRTSVCLWTQIWGRGFFFCSMERLHRAEAPKNLRLWFSRAASTPHARLQYKYPSLGELTHRDRRTSSFKKKKKKKETSALASDAHLPLSPLSWHIINILQLAAPRGFSCGRSLMVTNSREDPALIWPTAGPDQGQIPSGPGCCWSRWPLHLRPCLEVQFSRPCAGLADCAPRRLIGVEDLSEPGTAFIHHSKGMEPTAASTKSTSGWFIMLPHRHRM